MQVLKLFKNKGLILSYAYIQLFLFLSIPLFSQNDERSEFLSLISSGRYFEARDMYTDISNILSDQDKLYYKYHTASLLNREDSAAFFLETMINHYPEMMDKEIIHVYSTLFAIYNGLQDYKKSSYVLNEMSNFITSNPYNICKKEINRWKEGLKERQNYLNEKIKNPVIRVKKSTIKTPLRITVDTHLRFNGKYNGVTHNTILDTGVQRYFILNRKTAQKIGIELYDIDEMDRGVFNGTEMAMQEVILDSVELGNLTLYNMPALVLEHNILKNIPDSIRNDSETVNSIDSIYNSLNLIMGLPTMTLIGGVEIDWDKELILFSESGNENIDNRKDANMYIYDRSLYTRLDINGACCLGYIDSGSDNYVDIASHFYDDNKGRITLDTLIDKESLNYVMLHEFKTDVAYEVADKNLKVKFEDKLISAKLRNRIIIREMLFDKNQTTYDGVIGYHFLRNLGKKILFNFHDMRLEAIE